MKNTFIAHGSHGQLTVDVVSGEVLDRTGCLDGGRCDCDGYEAIERFDVAEYVAKYGTLDSFIDILDLGYWQEGKYEPPVADWREEFRGLPCLSESCGEIAPLSAFIQPSE